MQSFATYKSTVKPSVLILGAPGSGKTTLATMLGRCHVIELDNNIEGPFTYLTSIGAPCRATFDLPMVDAAGKLISRESRWSAMNKCIEAAVKADPTIDTLVIDGLTSLVDIALDEVRRQMKRAFGNPVAGTPDAPLQIQDWGCFAKLMVEWLTKLRASGLVLVVTAHTNVEKDDMAGYLKHFIAVPGQLRNTIAGMFTECWKCSVKNVGTGDTAHYDYFINTVGTSTEDALGLKSGRQIKPNTKVDFAALNKLLYS